MPELLETIEEIAIRLQRDVLFVAFDPPGRSRTPWGYELEDLEWFRSVDWETYQPRSDLMGWLDQHEIAHQDCYPPLGAGWLACPFMGTLYIDLPYDSENPTYLLLEGHLEGPEGKNKIPGVRFLLYPFSATITLQEEKRRLDTEWSG